MFAASRIRLPRSWSSAVLTTFAAASLAIAAPPLQADEASDRLTQEWFSQLGAEEFAVRERAATRLCELGVSIVPELSRLSEETEDAEVKLRAGEIIQQLTDGDMAGRIAAFIGGAEIELDGWRVTRAVLGDSVPIRELFIQIMQQHPRVLESLEETTRDRVMALEKTLSSIEHKMFKQLQLPNQADAFAMLLPIIDPTLPISERFEPIVLSVLRKEAVSKIHKDAQLSGSFKSLLNNWIARSSEENRDDVLEFTMLWDLEIGAAVAVQTLREIHEPETLAMALQAIARFGDREQIEYVAPLLDDRSVVIEQGFVRGKEVQTLLCDVAAVAIAQLLQVDLTELGYTKSVMHPTFSFLLQEIGYGKQEENQRLATLEKVKAMLKDDTAIPQGGPQRPEVR